MKEVKERKKDKGEEGLWKIEWEKEKKEEKRLRWEK